jgi:hypothetical protein
LCWHKVAGGRSTRQHAPLLPASPNRLWPSDIQAHAKVMTDDMPTKTPFSNYIISIRFVLTDSITICKTTERSLVIISHNRPRNKKKTEAEKDQVHCTHQRVLIDTIIEYISLPLDLQRLVEFDQPKTKDISGANFCGSPGMVAQKLHHTCQPSSGVDEHETKKPFARRVYKRGRHCRIILRDDDAFQSSARKHAD